MQPLTASEMRAWQTCQRGWWLTYYRGLRRKYDLPKLPTVGNLYHAGVEAHYKGELTDPEAFVAAKARQALEKAGLVEVTDVIDLGDGPLSVTSDVREAAELAAIMLTGYLEWVAETGVDEGLTVIATEQIVQAPIGPYTLMGKLDATVRRDADDATLLLEHKTVGNLTDIPKYAQSAGQFLTYDLLASLEPGAYVDGLLINMAKRVKRTARANPPFYARHEVRHNKEELRSHFKHVLAIGVQIEEARKRLDAGVEHHRVVAPASGRSHLFGCPCASFTTMFDDGSVVEEYLAEFFEQKDPLARYTEEEDG